MRYLFQLGHCPQISAAELAAVFARQRVPCTIVSRNNQYLMLNATQPLDTTSLMNRLGGTVKIGEQMAAEKNIPETIIASLTKQPGKITFSISGTNAKPLALAIKKSLKQADRSVRYLEPKNTATVLHNKLIEKEADFTVVNDELFVTRAIQPFEEFGERDYGRPTRDAKSGMLPPKLARIMINLAPVDLNATILDPFCGSGTILMEAMLMGYTNLIGADVSAKAIKSTRENLAWLQKNYRLSPIAYHVTRLPASRYATALWAGNPYQLFETNVHFLPKHLTSHSVDAIITEPYLGQPLHGHETKKALERQAAELASLYINAFQTFQKLLKPNGVVIFIIPQFKHDREWITVPAISEIKKMGFAVVPLANDSLFLLYYRPGQYVGRMIWKLKKY